MTMNKKIRNSPKFFPEILAHIKTMPYFCIEIRFVIITNQERLWIRK